MKKVLLTVVVCLMVSTVYAAKPNAGWQLVVDSGTVRDNTAGYTDPVLVSYSSDVSFLFTVNSGTSTDLKLEYQIIDSNSSNYSVIGSTNDVSLDPNFEVGFSSNNYTMQWADVVTGGVLVTSITSGKIAGGFSVPVTRWIRFKVTGTASSGLNYYSISIGRYAER